MNEVTCGGRTNTRSLYDSTPTGNNRKFRNIEIATIKDRTSCSSSTRSHRRDLSPDRCRELVTPASPPSSSSSSSRFSLGRCVACLVCSTASQTYTSDADLENDPRAPLISYLQSENDFDSVRPSHCDFITLFSSNVIGTVSNSLLSQVTYLDSSQFSNSFACPADDQIFLVCRSLRRRKLITTICPFRTNLFLSAAGMDVTLGNARFKRTDHACC